MDSHIELSENDYKLIESVLLEGIPIKVAATALCIPLSRAYRVMRHNTVQEMVRERADAVIAEYTGLETEVLRVLRDALMDHDLDVALKAVPHILKVLGRYKGGGVDSPDIPPRNPSYVDIYVHANDHTYTDPAV